MLKLLKEIAAIFVTSLKQTSNIAKHEIFSTKKKKYLYNSTRNQEE